MEKKDKIIRILWLIAFSLSCLMSAGRLLYQMQSKPPQPIFPNYQAVAVIFPFIALFGIFFLLYWCIYKKPGTKILFLILLINGASLILQPIALLVKTFPFPLYAAHSYRDFLFSMAMGTLWFILCLRMRRINQRLRGEQLKSPG